MKKEIHPGVVAGIIAVVVVIVVVLAWKTLAPPGPAGFKSMTDAEKKAALQQHAQSVKDAQQKQMELYNQSHKGGQ